MAAMGLRVGQEAVGITMGNLHPGRRATNGRERFVLLVSVEQVAAGATGA